MTFAHLQEDWSPIYSHFKYSGGKFLLAGSGFLGFWNARQGRENSSAVCEGFSDESIFTHGENNGGPLI